MVGAPGIYLVKGGVLRSPEPVRWISQLSEPPSVYSNIFSLILINLEIIHPIPRPAMSQFPSTVKALTFSKTGDVDVLEKTDQPFPQQGPGDVILKVRLMTTRPLASTPTHRFATMDVG